VRTDATRRRRRAAIAGKGNGCIGGRTHLRVCPPRPAWDPVHAEYVEAAAGAVRLGRADARARI